MDTPTDTASQGIRYSAIMGKQLWSLVNENVLQVREMKYPFGEAS